MGLLSDLQDELQSLIAEAWPEIVMPGGDEPETFWTEIQAFQENLVELAARALAGDTSLGSPPYAILQFGTETDDPGWGVASRHTRFPVSVYYVARQGAMDQVQLRDKMAELRALIDDPDAEFDTFQAIERGEIDTSADSPLNMALLVDAQTAFICAHVRWSQGLLVSED